MLIKKTGMYFAASLLCIFLAGTASAQRVDYSDSWLVNTSTSSFIAGSGITDESYWNYGHDYYVVTTLTSPDYSRSVTGYGGGGSCGTGNSQCSRADVSLSIVNNGVFEGGDYFVESVHEGYCPNYGMNLNQVFTALTIKLGASVTVLTKAALTNFYTKVANCNVHCPTDQHTSSTNKGQWIQSVVPFAKAPFLPYVCANLSLIYPGTSNSECADYEDNVPILGTPF